MTTQEINARLLAHGFKLLKPFKQGFIVTEDPRRGRFIVHYMEPSIFLRYKLAKRAELLAAQVARRSDNLTAMLAALIKEGFDAQIISDGRDSNPTIAISKERKSSNESPARPRGFSNHPRIEVLRPECAS